MTGRVPCTGAIIAGGRATRFGGSPKGLERVGGVRILDRVAAALRETCDSIVVVANDPAAGEWLDGVPVIPDERRDAGALGGVHAALTHAASPVLVLAWDSPFVPAALLADLRRTGEEGAFDAAVARSNSPWGFEPLCAWYAASCLPAIERQLSAPSLHAGGWLKEVNCVRVDAARWGDPDELFFNVNAAGDMATAEAIALHLAAHSRVNPGGNA